MAGCQTVYRPKPKAPVQQPPVQVVPETPKPETPKPRTPKPRTPKPQTPKPQAPVQQPEQVQVVPEAPKPQAVKPATAKAPRIATPPQKPVPSSPEMILGTGSVDSDKLAEFLIRFNPKIDRPFAHKFAEIYVEEAAAEGVNHDIAFSQMCLETGFLSYGGLVTPDMNNFCGLGSIGPGQEGEHFPSPEIGVRAQIQHLKAYATEEPPKREIVDPRRRWVRYGSATTIFGLAGAWAADREYGKKLKQILDALYANSFGL
ncbi:MAG: glucosaminidase domain-containing protein [Spirochaetaceae bacterium]|nr:glucosaminidase domain-containing protein [Spirochaetaceae bacterium]